MKQLTCEMCGSTDLLKQDGVFVCQTCGCKYSVEEARKMMIEGTVEVQGTVRVDNTDSINKYLINARRALMKEDWEEVEKYYNLVEQNSENNMEAVFFSSYGKAMLSMTDSDYFKRQQKFEVLNRSISVISDYYEFTTEDKEDVIKRINEYIKKMYNVNYVYERQELSVWGAIRSVSAVTGSKQWCDNLINSTKNAFVEELKQISQKHNETFIKLLINEYEYCEVSEKEISSVSHQKTKTYKLTVKRKPQVSGAATKINVAVSNGKSFYLYTGDAEILDLKSGSYNLEFSAWSCPTTTLPVFMTRDITVQVWYGAWGGIKAEII